MSTKDTAVGISQEKVFPRFQLKTVNLTAKFFDTVSFGADFNQNWPIRTVPFFDRNSFHRVIATPECGSRAHALRLRLRLRRRISSTYQSRKIKLVRAVTLAQIKLFPYCSPNVTMYRFLLYDASEFTRSVCYSCAHSVLHIVPFHLLAAATSRWKSSRILWSARMQWWLWLIECAETEKFEIASSKWYRRYTDAFMTPCITQYTSHVSRISMRGQTFAAPATTELECHRMQKLRPRRASLLFIFLSQRKM